MHASVDLAYRNGLDRFRNWANIRVGYERGGTLLTLKSPRLMNLPKSWSTDSSASRIVNFAFVSNLPVGEESNLKQKPCKHPNREAVRLY